MDYDYESIDSGIKDKIITEIEAEIKNDNSKFFEEQPPITINRDVWANLDYPDKAEIQEAIFGDKTSISLTREQVFDETKTKIKIMKVLMWGYKKPFGTPSKDVFESIAKNLTRLKELFEEIKEKQKEPGLERNDIENLFRNFENPKIKGLGKNAVATKSKLLYFFDVSFDGKRCLIYDSNVISFLNHTDDKLTLCEDCYGEYLILNSDLKAELELKDFIRKAPWEPTDDCYFEYLDLMNDLMLQLKTDSENDSKIKEKIQGKSDKEIEEQIELYMFEEGEKLADDKKEKLKELKKQGKGTEKKR